MEITIDKTEQKQGIVCSWELKESVECYQTEQLALYLNEVSRLYTALIPTVLPIYLKHLRNREDRDVINYASSISNIAAIWIKAEVDNVIRENIKQQMLQTGVFSTDKLEQVVNEAFPISNPKERSLVHEILNTSSSYDIGSLGKLTVNSINFNSPMKIGFGGSLMILATMTFIFGGEFSAAGFTLKTPGLATTIQKLEQTFRPYLKDRYVTEVVDSVMEEIKNEAHQSSKMKDD
ncbi:hypothetical protein [Vibrio sp. C8]